MQFSILSAHESMVCKFPAWSTTIPSSCPKNLGATLLGSLSDLPDLVRKMRAEVVVVAYSSGDQKSMVGVLRNVMAEGASVWVVPRLFELGGLHQTFRPELSREIHSG